MSTINFKNWIQGSKWHPNSVSSFQVRLIVFPESSRHAMFASSHRQNLSTNVSSHIWGLWAQLAVNSIYTSLTCFKSAKKRSLAPGDTRNSSLNHKNKQVTLKRRGTLNRTTPVGDAVHRYGQGHIFSWLPCELLASVVLLCFSVQLNTTGFDSLNSAASSFMV